MADWYVWSGATGSGSGADWANAFVNLTSISTKVAGDRFFVAHDHVQTQASALTITAPGTEALPSRIYCVNRAGSVPPVAADLRTTASVATTGASAISLAGSVAECNGVNFSGGDAAGNGSINIGSTNNRTWRLLNCLLKLNSTSSAARISWGSGAGANGVICENVNVQFGAVGQTMSAMGKVIWRNTMNALVGAIIPTSLLGFNGSGQWFVEGVDLSAAGAGKTLVNSSSNAQVNTAILKDCKLGAGVNVMAIPSSAFANVEAVLIRCDSGDTGHRTEKYGFCGSQVTDTVTLLTGGASDNVQPISWKFNTSANCELEFPFESTPIMVWNDTVGSPKTLTIEGTASSLPTDEDIWIEVQHLGTSGFPIASKASSRRGVLAAAANLATSAAVWANGLSSKWSMSVTFTPQEKGFVTVYVYAAKPSSIFYVDPKPVIT